MTTDDILKLAREHCTTHKDVGGVGAVPWRFSDYALIAFANAVRNIALEEVAGICNEYLDDPVLSGQGYATGCSAAIREMKS